MLNILTVLREDLFVGETGQKIVVVSTTLACISLSVNGNERKRLSNNFNDSHLVKKKRRNRSLIDHDGGDNKNNKKQYF